jgi:hypothetical protein
MAFGAIPFSAMETYGQAALLEPIVLGRHSILSGQVFLVQIGVTVIHTGA